MIEELKKEPEKKPEIVKNQLAISDSDFDEVIDLDAESSSSSSPSKPIEPFKPSIMQKFKFF